ncbi:MAG: 1-acyl-sn-glycerol-3-phosphate acyltransferase [Actinobacteria bacterium]|nr:1-acyl-sn-glycerol-3-phosphate acyltransferase [Actinomycetota bacterium]
MAAGKRPTLADEIRDLAKGWRWGRRSVVPRSAEPYALPSESRAFPTAWARTAAAGAAREVILRYGLRTVVWNETSPQIHGLDNLEGLEAPVMFISNHTSHLDASLIMTSLPREWREKTAVAAAKDYFFDVWWRSAFTALVYAGFPIERGGGERATDTARELVRDGWNLVVFPEGTRSPDGWVQRFRLGAARLCIELGIPCVPIAIHGAYQAMPKGRSWPKPGRPPISLRFGCPLDPREGETHQELSRRMFQAVAELFDEDRTTWWEALRRAERGETPKLSGPAGPKWLRAWEASRPLPRRGRRAWR